MIDTTIDVINKLGLHARASGKLIELAPPREVKNGAVEIEFPSGLVLRIRG